MDAGTRNIKVVFGQERRYLVPLFQRPYVWTQEDQWQPLWDDVVSLATRLLAGETPRSHFLGAIVLDHIRQPTGHVEGRLIIDGQQRLTTLQLLLEAFGDHCRVAGHDRLHQAVSKLTRNDDPLSDDPDEVFKIWPTNADQQHFRSVMLATTPAELREQYGAKLTAMQVNHPIADAYLFFSAVIPNWLAEGDEENVKDRFRALYDAIRDHMRFVVIDLDKEDDAQLIFETLNARGTPLLPADLVKNFLFHRLQLAGRDIYGPYKQYWAHFDENAGYWREELGRGQYKRARIDNFLQHYLIARMADDVTSGHLYSAFREHYKATSSQDADGHVSKATSVRDAEGHLADLQRYADVYMSFGHQPAGTRRKAFFDRLRAMDITAVYPGVLEIMARYGQDPATVDTLLGDIESWLVRRLVCGVPFQGVNKTVVDMVRILHQEGSAPVSAIRAHLVAAQGNVSRWPNDREFRAAWLDTPIDGVAARTRMLLEAIEYAKLTPKTEQVEIKSKLTLEHLMPREWRTHWPLPNHVSPDEAILRRERLVRTIGNLTLLTGSLNPEVSNGPWFRKQPAILEHSALAINRDLPNVWGEEAIVSRSEALFEYARVIWPHPAPDQ